MQGSNSSNAGVERAADSSFTHLGGVVKGASINLAGNLLGKATAYGYTIFLARILVPSQLGLYFLGLTFLQIVTTVSQLGLDVGLVRYVSLFHARKDYGKLHGTIRLALFFALPVGAIVGLVQALASGFIATRLFHEAGLQAVLQGLAPAVPFVIGGTLLLAATQGLQRMEHQVYVRQLAEPLVRFALTFVLFLAGLTLAGAVWAYTASAVLGAFLALALQRRLFRPYQATPEPPRNWKGMLAYSVSVIFARYMALLIFWADTIMLGLLGSSEEVGIYNVALRSITLGLVVMESLAQILAPLISTFHEKGEHAKLASAFASVSKWSFTFSFPIFLVFVLLRSDVMAVFGAEYRTGSLCLAILASSMLAHTTFGPIGRLTLMTGRSHLNLYNNIGVAVLNIVLNWALIPPYGIVGAAIATATSAILLGIIRLLQSVVLYRLHPFRASLLKPLSAGLVASLVALGSGILLQDASFFLRLAISAAALAVTYFALLFLLGIDADDRYVLDRMRARFRFR